MRRFAVGFVLLGLVAASCGDPVTSGRELEIDGTGAVAGLVFLDVNGNGTFGATDEPVEGIRVRLVPDGGGGAVASALTDTLGIFQMTSVPVGGFRMEVDPTTVPDSVQVFGLNTAPFILAAGDTVIRNFRLSFPTYTLAEIRDMEPGARVFTHGFALNVRNPFGDGTVHLREGNTYLRATSVERSPLAVGDSVRFLGRISTEAGRPVLHDVRVFILQTQAIFLSPVEISSAQAATANSEVLDAAFTRIRNARILDTIPEGDNLVVTADDGSGPVDLVLRSYLGWNRAAFRPDSVEFTVAQGLLVPMLDEGGTRWRLYPRATGDVSIVFSPPPEEGSAVASSSLFARPSSLQSLEGSFHAPGAHLFHR